MPLCLQVDIEQFLQEDIANEPEAAIDMLIARSQAAIEDYCDRSFEYAQNQIATIDVPAEEQQVVRLPNYPVHIINSLTENGDTLTAADDFELYPEDGRITRTSGNLQSRWLRGRRIVIVDFDAGFGAGAPAPFDSIPDTLRFVCAQSAARAFQAGQTFANVPVGAGAIKKLALAGSDSVEYDTDSKALVDVSSVAIALTDEDKMELSVWRRRRH